MIILENNEELKKAFEEFRECLKIFRKLGVKKVESFLRDKEVFIFLDMKPIPLSKEPILRETYNRLKSALNIIYASKFLKGKRYLKIRRIEVFFWKTKTKRYIIFTSDTDSSGDKNVNR
jgi:endo-alpha-1,4-polygalactosaminidase (GH114 family)